MVKRDKEPQGAKYQIGDVVACEHNGKKYHAKVLEVRKNPEQEKNPDYQFKIHYTNWSKNWDEWVSDERLIELTDDLIPHIPNFPKSAVKTKAVSAGSARKKSAGLQDKQNTSLQYSPQQKVADASYVDITEEPSIILENEKDVKLQMPDDLRNWLVDDDNNIKSKKLTALPAKPNVATILKDFANHRKTTGKTKYDKEMYLNELMLGMKNYFNAMLGHYLLYKFERLQYQQLLKNEGNDADLTQHYGVIHLVRLGTKIGKLLAESNLEKENLQTIANYFQELMKYIAKQPALFDLERNYTVAPPDYIKNALK